jgi:N6-adenosine-specific RNA methylase IME4
MLYRTILANPPWGVSTQRAGRGAEHHYPLMPIETIAALRLDRLVGDDAHLWLWVTNAHWREQLAVMEAWSFSYRSCLTWIKPQLPRSRPASPQLRLRARRSTAGS